GGKGGALAHLGDERRSGSRYEGVGADHRVASIVGVERVAGLLLEPVVDPARAHRPREASLREPLPDEVAGPAAAGHLARPPGPGRPGHNSPRAARGWGGRGAPRSPARPR